MAAPAGRDAAAPAAVPAVSPPQLRLNWPALTAAGYLDPDDLTAPLGQELARIGSILTRQTLSDQASWRDRIILVTSARPGEGKTFSAINFALELTRRKEHRITLVDADTIGAGATRRLGMQMEPGLTNALVDQRLPAAGIVTRTDLDRLSVVAAGPERDDVVDIFASRRMLQILRALTKDPRTLVVVDAPPILTRQETNVLSVIAGQVVLVVEAGRTTAEDVELALRRIGDRNNLALLLNRSGHAAQSKTASGRGLGGLNLGIDPGQAEPKRRLRKAAALALALLLLGIGATVAGELPGAALSACISCLPMLVWPAGS
jgi:Mrp family chromosome partitioning ATPase